MKLAARNLGDVPARELKGIAEAIGKQIGEGVVALVSTAEGKASVVVGVSPELTGRFSAVELVRAAAAAVGGKGGGGRPDMAQAGGPDAARGGSGAGGGAGGAGGVGRRSEPLGVRPTRRPAGPTEPALPATTALLLATFADLYRRRSGPKRTCTEPCRSSAQPSASSSARWPMPRDGCRNGPSWRPMAGSWRSSPPPRCSGWRSSRRPACWCGCRVPLPAATMSGSAGAAIRARLTELRRTRHARGDAGPAGRAAGRGYAAGAAGVLCGGDPGKSRSEPASLQVPRAGVVAPGPELDMGACSDQCYLHGR